MSDKQQEAFETFQFDTAPIRGFPELRWTGKKPFASTQFFPAQKKEAYGDARNGWWNRLYWGDNLQVLSHLLRDFRGRIDLIYIDPPFDSKAEYKKTVNLKGINAESDSNAFEEKQYNDIWSNDAYLQFIYERLILSRELLSESGCIYFHCDSHRVHYVKCMMDEVFGIDNFLNDIIWKRTGSHNSANRYGPIHDTILYYSKTKDYIWNAPTTPYDEEYEKRFSYQDSDGRKFQPISLIAAGVRTGSTGKPWKGIDVSAKGNHWRTTIEKLDVLDAEGHIYWPPGGGFPRLKSYLDRSRGAPVQDIWGDIPAINSQAKEREGYPTQKPEALLERIIKASSRPGEIVLDFFMGSGTTQAVAMRYGRRFIGADINLGAVETTAKRLNRLAQILGEPQANQLPLEENEQYDRFTGFEVYNVNNYDIFRNPVEAKELIKEAMELQPLPTSSVFDGQRDQYLVKIMPVNRIATRADLNEVINGMDFKAFERRQAEAPSKIVERIMLVCMGHEPDLGPELVKAAKPFNIEVEVVDLIRDKSNLHFKRQSDAKLSIKDGHLEVVGFYPLNLLQKLSMDTDAVEDWRQLVETIKIDWNYDGAVLSPELIDAPGKDELVSGRYPIPNDAATIRVKITDLLSESWEGEIENG